MSAHEALASLRDHLKTITQANGYPVTVATVDIGRAALAGSSKGPFPAIALVAARDEPDVNTAPHSKRQQWTRTVGFEATIQETANWDAELDLLWDAVRQALVRYTAHPLKWTPASFVPPAIGENGGGALCSIRFEISYVYRLTL